MDRARIVICSNRGGRCHGFALGGSQLSAYSEATKASDSALFMLN
jgi:hypothetical protein